MSDLRAHNFMHAEISLCARCVHACHHACNLSSPALHTTWMITAHHYQEYRFWCVVNTRKAFAYAWPKYPAIQGAFILFILE